MNSKKTRQQNILFFIGSMDQWINGFIVLYNIRIKKYITILVNSLGNITKLLS